MTSSSNKWQRLQTLYHEALERPAQEREAYLTGACQGDEELLKETLQLLKHAQTQGAAIQQAVGGVANSLIEDEEISNQVIGAYRIVREIGRGGMGRVYLAKRDDDAFEQTVAIKLLNKNILSEHAIAMFEMERQTLARLSHVNVAVLLDGGTTEKGMPYVVMQYVDGPRLDLYAEQHKLNLNERLALFLKVCAAVSHAHRNLVVHRDIKPSNVLVNSEGEPKLLDFGIAKMLDQQASGMTKIAIMTPPYASPEQVDGQSVTVQTDVYSLGALLYELATGKPPFDFERTTLAEAAVTIRQTMPELPSQVVGTPTIKAPALRGDLDNIILKAMRKEPERRYSSVQALADDIVAHQHRRPVSARPDSWRYRTSRFIARHTAPVAIASFALVTLLSLATYYTVQLRSERDRAIAAEQQAQEEAQRANQEAQTSQRVSEFLVGLFDVNDPRAGARKDITARELLDEGQQKIRDQLNTEPGVAGHLMRVMGLAYSNMGEYEAGIALLEDSLANKQLDPGGNPLDVAEAMSRLADILRQQGNLDRAVELHEQALKIRRELSTEPNWGLGDSLNNFGLLQYSMGNFDYAIKLASEAIDIHRVAKDSSPTSLGISMHNLSLYLRQMGQYELADKTLAEAMQHKIADGGRQKSSYAISLGLVALIKNDLADFAAAEDAMVEALKISDRVYEPDNPRMGAMWERVATTKCGLGQFESAFKHYEDALAIYAKSHGLRSAKHSAILQSKAACLLNQGNAKLAEALLHEIRSIEIELYTVDHVLVGITEVMLAHALLDQNKTKDVFSLLSGALLKLEGSFEPNHPQVIRAKLGLARLKARDNDAATALVAISDFSELLGKRAPSPLFVDSLLYASEAAVCAGDDGQARHFLDTAWGAVQTYATEHPKIPRFINATVKC